MLHLYGVVSVVRHHCKYLTSVGRLKAYALGFDIFRSRSFALGIYEILSQVTEDDTTIGEGHVAANHKFSNKLIKLLLDQSWGANDKAQKAKLHSFGWE